MRNLLWSGLVMALLLSSCGWSGDATRPNDITPLTSITITAAYSTIAQGTSVKLTATGNYSGLFTRDISDQVTWTSSATTVANFVTSASPNRITGLKAGSAVLTATIGSISATYTMAVSSATPTSVTITPVAPSVAQGVSQEFTATGIFSDSTTQVITFDAVWSSSDTSVATLAYSDSNDKETASSLAIGATTITATFGGVSGSTVLTVTTPVLQSIAITTPNNITSVLTLSTVTFTATGTYSNGMSSDITSQVSWTSTNTNVAPAPDSTGATQTATQGTAKIAATLGTIASNTTTLTVTGGNLVSFPALTTTTVVYGTSLPISVTGNFGATISRDITGVLKWSVDNTNIATVTTMSGNRVLIKGLATGSTTIRATYPGSAGVTRTSSATLTVTNPGVSSFAVSSPAGLALTAGTSGRLTATATFSDGTNQDVTANATWTSNAPAIATVGTVGSNGVEISGVAAGSTTIGVTFGSLTLKVPVPVTVTSRTLQSIAITPGGTQSVTSGNQTSFTATATYSGGFTQDVTADATWATGDGNIAILADSQNQPGQIVGVGSGSTSLTATFNGLTATVTIKVP